MNPYIYIYVYFESIYFISVIGWDVPDLSAVFFSNCRDCFQAGHHKAQDSCWLVSETGILSSLYVTWEVGNLGNWQPLCDHEEQLELG